jgi:hypothetical protein
MDGDFQLILAKLSHLEHHNEQLSAKVNLLESQLEKQPCGKSCKLENIEKQVQHIQTNVDIIHGEQVTSAAFDIYMASLEKMLNDLNSKVGCMMEQVGRTGAAKPIESIESCITDTNEAGPSSLAQLVQQSSDHPLQHKSQDTTTTQAAWAHVAAYDRVIHDNHENIQRNSNVDSVTAESDVDMDGGHWREETISRRNRGKRMRTNSGPQRMNTTLKSVITAQTRSSPNHTLK